MSAHARDRRCVVLGGGITGLAVVRSLGRAGLPTAVVALERDCAARSRWANRHFDDIRESADPEALVRALGERGIDEAVLFPCSDAWAQAVSRMSEAHRVRYAASISRPDVLDLLVDKASFYETLARYGIPHPKTRAISSADEIDASELRGHFLKPSDSQRFGAAYNKKAHSFHDLVEAREGLRHMAAAGVEPLLQEYIPGDPSLHYFVDGYLDREGVHRAVFVRRRTRMFPVPFGNSSHTVSIPRAAAEPAVQSVLALLTGIGFHGVFSAEFKRDPRDSRFKLLEVNGRPWWFIGFAADCGVDVTMLSYRDALGLELETISHYPAGERCVLLHLDVRAFFLERRERGLTFLSWLRSVVGAHSPMFTWDDPRPAYMVVTGIASNRLRQKLPARVTKPLLRVA